MSNSTTTSCEQREGQQEAQEQEEEHGEDGIMGLKPVVETVVVDPLLGLTESERISLLIRFGAAGSGGMCAAMSHGHSFQSSIFRLPAKCSGCHELVWGPFTRGCTCLTCSITVHRSCTGMVTMPPCPRKNVFDAFCRTELGLPPLARCATNDAEAVTATGSTPASAGNGGLKEAFRAGVTASGDLDEWATVEGTSAHSTSATTTAEVQLSSAPPPPPPPREQPPGSASCAVQDLGSSFFWSPLGFGDRKRPLSADTNEKQQQQQQQQRQEEQQPVEAHKLAVVAGAGRGTETSTANDAGDAAGCSSPGMTVPDEQDVSRASPTAQLAAATDDAASTAAGSNGTIGIGGVTKLSVAGGVVGALFGGPVGAVVGLNFGAVLGAGRSVQQGLWQRIERNRREAGAEGIGVRKVAGGATVVTATTAVEAAAAEEEEVAREPRDAWERIAKQVEGEHQPVVWELDPKQEKLLEQGECDAGEVAMFVVGKVLADDTAMLYHLYAALLAEFRSRHRLCDSSHRSSPNPIRRRSSDTDMVALFPRSCGRRSAAAAASATATATATGATTTDVDNNNDNNNSRFNRLDSSSAQQEGGFFASTPGLEKTYSFVEEAEMVAGEGSDTPSFDEEGEGNVGGSVEGSGGRRHDRRLSVARASECTSCGGRVTSGASQSGKFTKALARDVDEDEDEDEGGLGDGWAAAEAPPCWCRDEAGFSASPEDERNSLLAVAAAGRNGGTSRNGDAAEPPPDMNGGVIPEEALSGAGRHRGRGGDADQPHNGRSTAGIETTARKDSDEKPLERGMGEDTRDALRDVHGVLRELTRAVLEWCPLLTASHEAQIQAVNCIDQRVFSQTYGSVFERIAASGAAREGDVLLARRTRREERLRAADGRPSLLSTCRAEVVSALRAAGSARTGRDKLGFLVQAVERISDALPDQRTTDALIFSVCRHLAAATTFVVDEDGAGADGEARGEGGGGGGSGGRGGEQPALARPHAEVAFVEQFMRDESWIMGKEGYVLTTVIAALHVLNDPDMSDDVFLDTPPPPPPTAANSEDSSGVDGSDDAGGGVDVTVADCSGQLVDVRRE